MVIRKVGNEYCVFSEKGKNLGCSPTKEGAQKRLREVEFFKHSKGRNMLNEDIFDNFKLNEDTKTTDYGTIAGQRCDKLIDQKEHFPIVTQEQAKSAMNRVMKLEKVPDWYAGTLNELRNLVYANIKEAHPNLEIKISVPIATALSDGQTPSETKKSDITDPNDVAPKLVKEVKRPTLGELWLAEDEETRKVIANKLVQMLQEKQDKVQLAMDLANRLVESGLSGEEFEKLHIYLQEDVLSVLMQCGVNAQKQALIAKMNAK